VLATGPRPQGAWPRSAPPRTRPTVCGPGPALAVVGLLAQQGLAAGPGCWAGLAVGGGLVCPAGLRVAMTSMPENRRPVNGLRSGVSFLAGRPRRHAGCPAGLQPAGSGSVRMPVLVGAITSSGFAGGGEASFKEWTARALDRFRPSAMPSIS